MLLLVKESRVGVCFFCECGCECVGKAKRKVRMSVRVRVKKKKRIDAHRPPSSYTVDIVKSNSVIFDTPS